MFVCGPAFFDEPSSTAPLAFVGGTTGHGTGASYAISLSGTLSGGLASSPAAGDIVIVCTGWASGTDDSPGVSTAGYTNAHTDLYANDSRDPNMVVAYKVMGATPDTSVTALGANNAFFGGATAVHVWRGVNATTPMDVTATTAIGINGSDADSPSITPVTAGAVVLSCGLATGSTTTPALTGPSGMSHAVSVADHTSTNRGATAGIASFAWSAGAYDPAAWTGGDNTTSDAWCASTLVLRPA